MKNKTCGECKWFFLNTEGHCISNDGSENANNDACTFFERKIITNGDKIRSMSDEELAELLTSSSCNICCRRDVSCVDINCRDILLTTLKQEAKDENKEN